MTQAKRDTKAVSEQNSPAAASAEAAETAEAAEIGPSEPAGPSEPIELSVEDETRRRFREALERKNATPGTHPGSQVDGGSHLKSSNGKRKREFRRKSGG